MVRQQQQTSTKNYFISTDFFLRTILFLITLFIIILQHLLTLCEPLQTNFLDRFFTPSFGTNSWSATGLYVTCWAMLLLYLHTISLVFLDNFQIQSHPTTFVIQDIISSIFFLAWMITNVVQLSHCSKGQLAVNRNETQWKFEKPFCASIPCSIYLAPSIGSFMAMFTAIGLAGRLIGESALSKSIFFGIFNSFSISKNQFLQNSTFHSRSSSYSITKSSLRRDYLIDQTLPAIAECRNNQ